MFTQAAVLHLPCSSLSILLLQHHPPLCHNDIAASGRLRRKAIASPKARRSVNRLLPLWGSQVYTDSSTTQIILTIIRESIWYVHSSCIYLSVGNFLTHTPSQWMDGPNPQEARQDTACPLSRTCLRTSSPRPTESPYTTTGEVVRALSTHGRAAKRPNCLRLPHFIPHLQYLPSPQPLPSTPSEPTASRSPTFTRQLPVFKTKVRGFSTCAASPPAAPDGPCAPASSTRQQQASTTALHTNHQQQQQLAARHEITLRPGASGISTRSTWIRISSSSCITRRT